MPEEAPLVGIVASLRSLKKGHADFLRAATLVLRELPQVRFAIIGQGGKTRLQWLARRLGIADNLVFTGFIDDMPAAYAALDIVVCASRHGEGLTGVIREAFGMGRAVVSTDIAGNREFVQDGRTGRLVPIGDIRALANAIAGYVRDPAAARAAGEAGRRLMKSKCTNDLRAARVEQIYRHLLAQ